MSLDLGKSDEPVIWRITKLKIVECSLVDNPANDMATIESVQLAKRYDGEVVKKYSPEFKKYMISKGFGYLVGEPEDPLAFLKASNYPVDAAINPATGTNSASRGPGAQFGSATPEAMATADAAERFANELITVITQLGEENENSDLSPAEVLRQAIKVAAQRALNITDMSGDNGNPDPSLNPNGPAARATGSRRESGDDDFENLFVPRSGFELKKRLDTQNDLNTALMAIFSKADRVTMPGTSSALLKADDNRSMDLRKAEFGDGHADLSRIVTEVGDRELIKRLSEREAAGVRKVLDFHVGSRDSSVPEWRGSASPGILGDDLTATLAKRLKNIRPTTIEDLLH